MQTVASAVSGRFPKGGLSRCKRRSFTVRKVAFWNAKGHLLQNRWHATVCASASLNNIRCKKQDCKPLSNFAPATKERNIGYMFRVPHTCTDFRQDRLRLSNENKKSFYAFLFCIAFGLHYLCIKHKKECQRKTQP